MEERSRAAKNTIRTNVVATMTLINWALSLLQYRCVHMQAETMMTLINWLLQSAQAVGITDGTNAALTMNNIIHQKVVITGDSDVNAFCFARTEKTGALWARIEKNSEKIAI